MSTLESYWSLIVGAGFAVVGAVGAGRRVAPRVRVLAWGFVLIGVLLLAVALLFAVHRQRAAQVLLPLAVVVLLPLVLARITVVGRAPRSRRSAELGLLAAGSICVLGAALETAGVELAAALTAGVVLFCAGWLQFELTTGDQRRQVLWLALGAGFAASATWLFVVAASYIPISAAGLAAVAGVLCLPVPITAGIALLAPRAADVRFVISRSVVLIVMVNACVAVFAGAAALLELWQGHRPALGVLALLATALAAVFHPVLARVQISMDELLFGGRADPVVTLTRLGSQLTAGASPQEWLDMLRAALAVPSVELRQADGEVIAVSGDPDGPARVVTPLQVGAVAVGELVVALPDEQLRLSSTTQAVLGLVAAPLAQALQADRLNEQVQASRGRVVLALEEERRRVRRDLHDGLGPTLTGIAYSADAAANLISVDAGQAAGLLLALRADAGEAIAEVRRIVYGLRPRALDELGLVGAVQQRVSRLGTPDGRALAVQIVAPGALPELPAAVEVVAYRVAVEAAANVARHARVAAARIEFALPSEDLLVVSVDDAPSADAGAVNAGAVDAGAVDAGAVDAGDSPAGGDGAPAGWRFGVGLTSMRERVEQLGGVLQAGPTRTGGRVCARIPMLLPAGPAGRDVLAERGGSAGPDSEGSGGSAGPGGSEGPGGSAEPGGGAHLG